MDRATEHESEWLIHVEDSRRKDEVEAGERESLLCIFGIAPPLLRLRPESYIPQVISIGPYHYKKLQHYEEMDAYKLKMASALERDFSPFKFTKLVERVWLLKDRIRACYHKHIQYDVQTLSWMLALDASFIVQFLVSSYRIYGVHTTAGSRLMHKPTILQSKRKTLLWFAMKNDILMLENQVPTFLLIEVLCVTANFILSETEVRSQSQIEISQHNGGIRRTRSQRQIELSQHNGGIRRTKSQSQIEISQAIRSEEKLYLGRILQAACLQFNPFLREKPAEFNVDVESKSHVLDYLYGYVTASSPKTARHNCEPQNKACGSVLSLFKTSLFKEEPIHHARGMDRIKRISATTAGNLPSASQLSEAGIKFAPYDSGDLEEIKFKKTISTLFLPKIKIDGSTEVVLRNLIALEVNLHTEQKPLTRYTYLMDHLIDTERDVALLKRCGILISKMRRDTEVSQMWNSMNAIRWETTFDPIDKAIEETNKHYGKKWSVILAQFHKRYCSRPWLNLSLLSGAILMSLTATQVFCLFYTCSKKSSSN